MIRNQTSFLEPWDYSVILYLACGHEIQFNASKADALAYVETTELYEKYCRLSRNHYNQFVTKAVVKSDVHNEHRVRIFPDTRPASKKEPDMLAYTFLMNKFATNLRSCVRNKVGGFCPNCNTEEAPDGFCECFVYST